ncbi:MAG: hypothetical protein AAGA70_13430 [Pseudomonadota bacterium]
MFLPSQPEPEELRVQLSRESRALLEEIKRDAGYHNDAQAIRAALALQHHVARRLSEGFRLYLGDDQGNIGREVKIGDTR